MKQQSSFIQSCGLSLGLEELLHPNLNRLAELMLITQAGALSKIFATRQKADSQMMP